jgi:hypothetical protein
MLSDGGHVCYYVLRPGGEITVIAGDGILTFTADNAMLGQIAQLLNRSRFVVFGGPASQDFLLRTLGLNPGQSFAPDLFATGDFIANAQARVGSGNHVILYEYLSSIGFIRGSGKTVLQENLTCPICAKIYTTPIDVYRCLYRTHSPFPSYVMNRMRVTGTKAGVFMCSVTDCRETLESYDQFVRHVYESHRTLLLNQTAKELHMFEDLPALTHWIKRELSCIAEDAEYGGMPMDGFGARQPGYPAYGSAPVFGNASERG